MGLPKKHLYNDEQIVLDLHPHWWFLAPRVAALVSGLVLAGWVLVAEPGRSGDGFTTLGSMLRIGVAIVVAVLVGSLLVRLVQWSSVNFVVTTERCIYRAGVFAKQGIEIPLDRISTVFFHQTVFERLVGAGDIAIESAGEGSRQSFSDISKPLDVQNEIYRQMEAYEDRRSDRLGHAVSEAHGVSVADEITKLADLLRTGVISQAEFDQQKAKLLG